MNSYRLLIPVFMALMILALSQITLTGASIMAAPVPPDNDATIRNQFGSVDMTIVNYTDSPDPATAGETILYQVLLLNGNEDTPATDVVLTFTLSSDVTYDPTALLSDSDCSVQSGNLVTCALGTLAALQARFVSIVVDVDPTARGTATASVEVTSNETDSDLANNSDSRDTTIQAESDLSLTKSDSPDPVIAGEQVSYTLTVHNAGPSAALNVALTDTLSSPLTLNSVTPSQGSCPANFGSNNPCDLGQLEPNSSATVTIVADVDPLARGTISNKAGVASEEADPDSSNNSDSEETTIDAETNLTLTKSSQPNPVVAGEALTYTLTVQNNGPSTATGVQLTDTLPAGITFDSSATCSDDGGVVSCPLDTLEVGEMATVTLVTMVSEEMMQAFDNDATATSLEGGNSSDSHRTTLTIRPPSEVTIDGPTTGGTTQGQTFMASVSPENATLPLTYTWEATDQSPITHQNDGLTDTVPFTWTTPGLKSVTVTVANAEEEGNAVTASHVITISQPKVQINQIIPNPAWFGELVEFNGSGTSDEMTDMLEEYEWKRVGEDASCKDSGSVLADSARFLSNSLPTGKHKICLRARNADNVWSGYESMIVRVRADRWAYSDIAVNRDDITFFISGTNTVASNPMTNSDLEIEVNVHNISLVDTPTESWQDSPNEIVISLYEGEPITGTLIGSSSIISIAAGSEESLRIPWTVPEDFEAGYHVLSVDLEYKNNIPYFANDPLPPYDEPHIESLYENNQASTFLIVGEPDRGTYGITVTADIAPLGVPELYTGYDAKLFGDAKYDWGSHVPSMGAEVSIEIVDADGQTHSTYNTFFTKAPFGRYDPIIELPSEPGTYTATIWVFDNNLRGKTTLSFEVVESPEKRPDLYVERFSVGLSGPNVYHRSWKTYAYERVYGHSMLYGVQNEPITITAKIHNRGNLNAGTFNVSFYDGIPGDGGILLGTETVTGGLNSGDSTPVTHVWTPSESREYAIQVVVDEADVITESNETNNYDSYYYKYQRCFNNLYDAMYNCRNRAHRDIIQIKEAKPDLRALGLRSEGLNKIIAPNLGDVITLTVDIHNIGHNNMTAGQAFTVTYYDGYPVEGVTNTRQLTGTWPSDLLVGPDELGPHRVNQSMVQGASLTFPIVWNTSHTGTTSGLHHICVAVDTGKEVDEEFEANNLNCWDIYVYPSGHDLWPVGISFSNNTPQHNTPISITATIRNRGADAFTGTETVKFYTSHPDNGEPPIGTATISGTINGRDATGTTSPISWTTPDAHGSAYIYAEIVVKGVSRVYVRRLNVYPDPPPNLRLRSEDIHHDPNEPSDGDHVSVSVEITNIGSGDATDVIVRFYTDSPTDGFVPLGSPRIINSLLSGDSETKHANATFEALAPYYSIIVEAVPPTEQGDKDWSDNDATTSVWVVQELTLSSDSPKTLCETVTLNASLPSYDDLQYSWEFGDESGTVSDGETSHQYTNPGVYTVTATTLNWPFEPQLTESTQVTVTDCAILGLQATNDSPTTLSDTTTLDASITAGSNVTYQWDLGDGSSATGAEVTHVYGAVGVYTATVTASNSVGTQEATTVVTIRDVEIAGLAAHNDSPTTLSYTTTLDASISAGSNVTYQWDLGDGSFASGAQVTHTYGAVGVYTATVTASNSVTTLQATTVVTITDVEIAGLAAHNDSPTTLSDTTTLSATLSAGTDVTYTWDFGDGSSATGAVVNHTYAEVGVYTATVTASNPEGTQEATTVVTITDIPITGLHATNDSPTLLGDTTTLTATIATGTDVTYEWALGDGTSASGAVVSHGYSSVGPYTAVVTATNSVGTVITSTEVSILPANSVILVLNPPTITTGLGETFELPIEVWAGIQPVDGATAHLNYDPTYLEVLSIAGGEDFSIEILNEFDNQSGELNFAAGSFNGFPNGTFNLATVTFRTKALTEETGSPIDFNMTLPRLSDATFDGVTVLSHTINSTIFVEKSALLALEPLTITALVGESFELPILVEAGTQPIDGASAYLNFDPMLVEVVSITEGSELPSVLANSFDNDSGELEFAAGTLTEPYPTGTFTLATVTFRTLASTDGTPITFNTTAPQQSDLTFDGTSVLKQTTDGSTVIVPKIVQITLDPASMTVDLGQPFDLPIVVTAGSQEVNAAKAEINFDVTHLQVISITSDSALPIVLSNIFDNSTGEITFMGTSMEPVSGTFTLGTITFSAIAQTDNTALDFNGMSDVALDGATVLSDTTGSEISIRSANLVASVTLQGRPAPPNSRWSVPLRVSFTKVGESTPAYEFTPTTDNSGTFTITNQLAPGSYEVRVKKPNSLQNTTTVTLSAGNNTLDLGTLLEGDANDDNYVTLVDFSILVSTFAKCDDMPDYDARADFNSDNCVTILDFSLLASNFAESGDHSPQGRAAERRAPTGNAKLIIDNPIIQAQTGNTYHVAVYLEADSPVDGAAAYINFDQSLLKVNSITGGDTFDLVLQNEFDNQSGMIAFAAGTLTPPLPGGEGLGVRGDLAVIELEAIGNGESPLLFQFDAPRSTDITSSGQSVLSDYVDGSDSITPTPVEVAQLAAHQPIRSIWMALLVMGALLLIGVGREAGGSSTVKK